MLGIGRNDVTNSYVMAVVLVVLIAGMPEPGWGAVNPITIRGSRFCPHFNVLKVLNPGYPIKSFLL